MKTLLNSFFASSQFFCFFFNFFFIIFYVFFFVAHLLLSFACSRRIFFGVRSFCSVELYYKHCSLKMDNICSIIIITDCSFPFLSFQHFASARIFFFHSIVFDYNDETRGIFQSSDAIAVIVMRFVLLSNRWNDEH